MCLNLWQVAAIAWLVVAAASPTGAQQFQLPTWRPSPWFEERTCTYSIEPGARVHVNAPVDVSGNAARGTRLIIYALPNGNTIEHTLGCQLAEGVDWRFDIQHVAAQLRLLRSLDRRVSESLGETRLRERIVLICAEAAGLSWPKWRGEHADANAKIARMVQQWREQYGEPDCKITLTGHSGGGSFMFGEIEAHDDIPPFIDRIAFLDANYSFDAALHADKLARWLSADNTRRLVVVAYDDREIVYDGKKVVGPTGGTFRATSRMRDAFGSRFPLVTAQRNPFIETTGLDRRIHLYVHPNPDNRILHTALVGEMNGLAHIETLGTRFEEKWGRFGGPRAYTKWIQPQPEPNPSPAGMPDDAITVGTAQLPSRTAEAIGGKAFIESLEGFALDAREAAIFREITSGNFPEFLRNFKGVEIRGAVPEGRRNKQREMKALMQVMPDYLAVGSDADFVRIPMTPQTAQHIADELGCVLPTRKMVEAIDQHAELHLPPHPLTENRESSATFLQHHALIERQRSGKPLGLLTIGIKKDIVLSPRIFERPARLAIYGWRQLDGRPIQPLTIVHSNHYVDYSHGARLVLDSIVLDGELLRVTDLLADPARCALVSDEGPMNPPAYPLESN